MLPQRYSCKHNATSTAQKKEIFSQNKTNCFKLDMLSLSFLTVFLTCFMLVVCPQLAFFCLLLFYFFLFLQFSSQKDD